MYGQGWITVAALTLAALVSGMISSIGAVASVSGLLLLLNSVVGAGLPMPGEWWLAPVLMTGGGLLVLALALLAWPLRAGVPERAAVADTYRRVADLLATTTTDDPDGAEAAYEAARHLVTRSLDQSYDLVLARRARHHGRSPELVRLLAQLNAITPLVEAAPAVRLSGRPLPAEIPAAVRHLAEAVETAYSGPLGLRLPEPGSGIGRAVDQALRHAADVAAEKSPDALKKTGDRAGSARPAEGARRPGRPERRPLRRLLALRPAPRAVHRHRAGPGVARGRAALVLGRADHHVRAEAGLRVGLLPGRCCGRSARSWGSWSRPGSSRRCRAAGGTCP